MGYDFSDEAAGTRPRRGRGVGVTNAPFVAKDVATLDDRAVRLHHDVRRGPRPGEARLVVRGIHGALKAGGYWLCVDVRVEPCRRERRPSAGHVVVHHELHALHDGVARLRRRGPRDDVGRTESHASSSPIPDSTRSRSTPSTATRSTTTTSAKRPPDALRRARTAVRGAAGARARGRHDAVSVTGGKGEPDRPLRRGRRRRPARWDSSQPRWSGSHCAERFERLTFGTGRPCAGVARAPRLCVGRGGRVGRAE